MTVYSVLAIAALAGYVGLVVLVLRKSYRETLYRSMAVYLATMAYWQFTSLMVSLSATEAQALLWYRLMTIGPGVAFILFFSFVTAFRNDPKRARLRDMAHLVSAILAVSALLFGHLLVPGVHPHPVTGFPVPDFGVLIPVLFVVSLYFTTVAVRDLAGDYRRSKNEEHRNRIRYLLLGIFLVFVGGLANFSFTLRGFPVDMLCNVVHALLITYAIVRHRLLDIKLVLRTGLVYSIMTVGITAAYLVLMFALKNLFSDLSGYSTYTAAVVLAFIIAVTFHSLQERLQRNIDRLFWGRRFRYYKMLNDFAAASVSLTGLEELAAMITSMVQHTLQVEAVALLVQEEEGKDYTVVSYTGPERDTSRIRFSSDSPLARWTSYKNRPLLIREVYLLPQFHSLWKAETESLQALQAEVFYPLNFQDRLLGILTVSGRHSGAPLGMLEMDLMKLFTSQITVAVNNALLYERVRRLSVTDPLTGVYNRRFFADQIMLEKERLKQGEKLGMIMLDVQNFKHYNDRYGHPAGDRILKELAAIIQQCVRPSDIVVRYGGDEFAVLLPRANTDIGRKVSARIRRRIDKWNEKHGLQDYNEKLSVYMGSCVAGPEKVEELVTLADRELYLNREKSERRHLLRALETLGKDRQNLSLEVVLGLARAVETIDPYTRGHSERVSRHAVALAGKLGLSGPETEKLHYAAMLHDVGKIAIPKSILQKVNPLNREERLLIQEHVLIGEDIISEIKILKEIVPLIRHHHERYDGRGYPDRLAGEEIPLGARILAVVDSFDAMTSERPYRHALTLEEALQELEENAGTQFDPEVALIFMKMEARSRPVVGA